MSKRLTAADLARAASAYGLSPRLIRAVAAVESNGRGHADDGRPIVRFEPHWFQRLTKGAFDASHPRLSHAYGARRRWPQPSGQATRYSEQVEPAMALDRGAAIRACSWGMFQMMGFNHGKCGFESPEAFLEAHWASEGEQLFAMLAFVKASGLIDELKRKDWAGFAYGYNGPDFASGDYDGKLRRAYEAAA